jgi:acetyl-CoA carboxylase biotin carboxyl carrier protein
MDFDDIKQILNLVREHDLAEFELERDGLKIRIRKSGREFTVVAPPMTAQLPAAPAVLPGPASLPAPPATAPVPPETDIDLAVLKSPIVGTFYRSSEPGAPAFVEVGDQVRKGQVLCIIEAMKLMNDIECDRDGEIAAIYVENGQAVQFGERLFAIKVS